MLVLFGAFAHQSAVDSGSVCRVNRGIGLMGKMFRRESNGVFEGFNFYVYNLCLPCSTVPRN